MDIGGKFVVMLKQETVGRVRVDLQLSLRDKTRDQVAVVGMDHRVAVAVCHQRWHLDGTKPLQETVVWAPPRANGVILRQAGLPGRGPVSVLLPGRHPLQRLLSRLPAGG